MKCAKCGYFSFDYLSECKKCRTNMVDARQRFGFSGVRPAIPSLLGSLLREYEPAANPESDSVGIAMSGTLDFEEGLDGEPRQAEPANGAAATAPVIANTEEAEEDFSLLDLSDEELDLLIDKGTFVGGDTQPANQTRGDTENAVFTISQPLSSVEPSSPVFKTEPAQTETPLASGPEEFELVLGTNDYPLELKDEPAVAPPGGLDPEFTPDPAKRAEGPNGAHAEVEALPEQAAPQCGESGDDFVIELSEDDLDNLLVKLSHPPIGEAGAESKTQG